MELRKFVASPSPLSSRHPPVIVMWHIEVVQVGCIALAAIATATADVSGRLERTDHSLI